jgi:predicted Rossmann fold flavoprotein
LDHAEKAGKKILISGGGRCNFTNRHCRPEHFLSANPHFAKSALARYTPADFIALVEKHRIPYHEKTLGQLFCDRSARDITGLLEEECRAARVNLVLRANIQEVRRTTEFIVHTARQEFRSPALVVATGGLSIPKMGATALGYDLARQFGHAIAATRPALVPLTLAAADRARYTELTGVSAGVIAACNGARFREKMLFTHRGLSGPAILQISSYWKRPERIFIDLAPDCDVTRDLRASPSGRDLAAARASLRSVLPQRLADRWLQCHAPPRWSNAALDEWERLLHAWPVLPDGTEGYEKAEVTAGGVDTDGLHARTLESRSVPGLFFIGEVVDVTGHLGGFNFQWAWASGFCAGQAVGAAVLR